MYYIIYMQHSLGSNVYLYRRALGWTQQELARKAGIPRPNLSAIEKGKRDATVSTVHKIARTLGVKAGDLVDGRPPRLPENVESRDVLEAIADVLITGDQKKLSKIQRTIASLLGGLVHERISAAGFHDRFPRRDAKKMERDWSLLKNILPQTALNSLLQRLDKRLQIRPN